MFSHNCKEEPRQQRATMDIHDTQRAQLHLSSFSSKILTFCKARADYIHKKPCTPHGEQGDNKRVFQNLYHSVQFGCIINS